MEAHFTSASYVQKNIAINSYIIPYYADQSQGGGTGEKANNTNLFCQPSADSLTDSDSQQDSLNFQSSLWRQLWTTKLLGAWENEKKVPFALASL